MAATYLLSLYPACLGAAGMGLTTVVALKAHIKFRYAIKDEASGKRILETPYNPYQKIKGREEEVSKVFRAYRAYENSKEWCNLIMPFMFISSIYGASIPYVTERTNQLVVGTTAFAWCVSNAMFIKGYAKSTEGRMTGFSLRMKCSYVFFFHGLVALGCYGYQNLVN